MISLNDTIVAGIAASWMALVIHEVSHALAAWLVGVRIWGIRLGVRPVIRSDGAHLLLHVRAARSKLNPALSA